MVTSLDFDKLEKVVEVYERRNPDDMRARNALDALCAGNAQFKHLKDLERAAAASNDWIHTGYPTINRAARRAVRAAHIIRAALISQIGVFGDGSRNPGYGKIAMEDADKLLLGEEVA